MTAGRREIEQVDVLILGGGPAGLSVLNELFNVWQGLSPEKDLPRVCLVDANHQPCGGSALPKGQYLTPRTCELWSRWDPGMYSQIAAKRMLPADVGTDIAKWSTEEKRASIKPSGNLDDFSAYKGLRIQQPLYESVLRDFASQCCSSTKGSSFQTNFGMIARNIERIGDYWEVAIAPSHAPIKHYAEKNMDASVEATIECSFDGSAANVGERIIRAKYLVGSDGGRSFVRHSCFERMQGKGSLGASMTIVIECPSLLPVLQEQFQLDSGSSPLFYNFKKPGMHTAGIGRLEGTSKFYCSVFYEDSQQVPAWASGGLDSEESKMKALNTLKSHCDIINAQDAWSSVSVLECFVWKPYSLCSPQWQRQNAFLVGDAAKLLSPTGGLGANTAVEDAVNLGWRLAYALFGSVSDPNELLAPYGAEQKQLWKRCDAFTVKALNDTNKTGVRDYSNYAVPVYGEGFQSPRVKNRLPFDRELFQQLNLRGFTVLTFCEALDATHAMQVTTKCFPGAKHVCLPRLANVYKSDCVVIIRPDFVIAWMGSEENSQRITSENLYK